ncbi:cyclopropane-fatty-acyl-phospholipid synthase [Rhizobiales bacterium GAS191]|nr:cyclopropane-fatty-acyl-phospholipid synthase [Rhizobiales bacterium GAS191]
MIAMFDRLLINFLKVHVKGGTLHVVLPSGASVSVGDLPSPKVGVKIADAAAIISLLRDPDLAFGELFMDQRLQLLEGSVYDLLSIAAQSVRNVKPAAWILALRRLRDAAWRLFPGNPKAKAKANVAHHYDLDFRLYRTFLDEDFQYSCAYFESEDQSLDDAQLAKKRHIAAKLLVRPGQHVLDIGCGWGGLALYLARVCKARVTGVTLSEEQHKVARARVAKEGLEDMIDIRLMDYRDVEGTFDRVVSVGMFEHVGKGDYRAFFDKLRNVLPEDGVALLHTIGCGDEPGPTNPWVTKYIFPGGYIPALSDMTPVIEKSDLITTDIETLRLHYAYTLKAWRDRFLVRRDEMAKLYDERFCRMWEFFLAASEAAFRFDRTLVFQVQMAKHEDTVPITRDYIARREAEFRKIEAGLPPLAPIVPPS